MSNVGTNTMTWNGSLASGASTTITVNAVIDAGTTGQSPANQGMLAFDADGDGSNEASAPTDDPGIAGGADPTVFSIVSPALVGATKTVSGSFVEGGAVVYTVTLANAAATAQLDNPGDEFVASNKLYGGSITQFSQTFKKFGWNVRFVDCDDMDAVKRAVNEKTKAIFAECLANPGQHAAVLALGDCGRSET